MRTATRGFLPLSPSRRLGAYAVCYVAVFWRRAGILEIQTGVSRSHRVQGESGAPVRFTLHIVLSASDYHINLAQSSSEGYRYIWLRWVGLEPTILLVMSQTRCRFSTPQN